MDTSDFVQIPHSMQGCGQHDEQDRALCVIHAIRYAFDICIRKDSLRKYMNTWENATGVPTNFDSRLSFAFMWWILKSIDKYNEYAFSSTKIQFECI